MSFVSILTTFEGKVAWKELISTHIFIKIQNQKFQSKDILTKVDRETYLLFDSVIKRGYFSFTCNYQNIYKDLIIMAIL